MPMIAAAPEWNRCITFTTPEGPVTVKVLGDDATAAVRRDGVLAALAAAGVTVTTPTKTPTKTKAAK
jgi:hypothetical protein